MLMGIDLGVNVVMLFRDNERYIRNFFQTMMRSGISLEIPAYFVFVENGSKDQTHSLLAETLEDKSGVLVTLGNTREMDTLPRTLRISRIRNETKQFVRASYKYTLLVDSDIYFEPDRISHLLRRFCQFEDSAAMLCAYGVEAYPQLDGTFTTVGHYYDTFAFVDVSGRNYWPDCVFPACKRCRSQEVEMVSDGLVQVRSAFGGMAILRTVDYLVPSVLYMSGKDKKSEWTCEHIGFCESLSKVTGKSIFVDTQSIVYWDRSSFNA